MARSRFMLARTRRTHARYAQHAHMHRRRRTVGRVILSTTASSPVGAMKSLLNWSLPSCCAEGKEKREKGGGAEEGEKRRRGKGESGRETEWNIQLIKNRENRHTIANTQQGKKQTKHKARTQAQAHDKQPPPPPECRLTATW